MGRRCSDYQRVQPVGDAASDLFHSAVVQEGPLSRPELVPTVDQQRQCFLPGAVSHVSRTRRALHRRLLAHPLPPDGNISGRKTSPPPAKTSTHAPGGIRKVLCQYRELYTARNKDLPVVRAEK